MILIHTLAFSPFPPQFPFPVPFLSWCLGCWHYISKYIITGRAWICPAMLVLLHLLWQHLSSGNPDVLSWLLPPDSRRLSPLRSEFLVAQQSSHSSCSGTGLQDFIWPGVDLFDGELKAPSLIKNFLLLVLLWLPAYRVSFHRNSQSPISIFHLSFCYLLCSMFPLSGLGVTSS